MLIEQTEDDEYRQKPCEEFLRPRRYQSGGRKREKPAEQRVVERVAERRQPAPDRHERVAARADPQGRRDQEAKAESDQRLRSLCHDLEREQNPAKIRQIKDRLTHEFYYGDNAS